MLNFKKQRRGATTAQITAIGIAACAILVTVGYFTLVAGKTIVKVPTDTLDAVTDDMTETVDQVLDIFGEHTGKVWDKAMTPTHTEGSKTYTLETAGVTELATIEQTYEHHYTYRTKWLLSEKEIVVKAHYKAKAGFKFDSPLELRFDDTASSVEIAFPSPIILSNEQVKVLFYDENGGLINSIQDKDRKACLNELKRTADERLRKEGFAKRASVQFTADIKKAIHAKNDEIEVKYTYL